MIDYKQTHTKWTLIKLKISLCVIYLDDKKIKAWPCCRQLHERFSGLCTEKWADEFRQIEAIYFILLIKMFVCGNRRRIVGNDDAELNDEPPTS